MNKKLTNFFGAISEMRIIKLLSCYLIHTAFFFKFFEISHKKILNILRRILNWDQRMFFSAKISRTVESFFAIRAHLETSCLYCYIKYVFSRFTWKISNSSRMIFWNWEEDNWIHSKTAHIFHFKPNLWICIQYYTIFIRMTHVMSHNINFSNRKSDRFLNIHPCGWIDDHPFHLSRDKNKDLFVLTIFQ